LGCRSRKEIRFKNEDSLQVRRKWKYRDSLNAFTVIHLILVSSEVRLLQASHRQSPVSALMGLTNRIMIDIVEIKYSGGRCHRIDL
jgi:hypothetical protein